MPLDPHVSRFLDMMALGSSDGITLDARREGMRTMRDDGFDKVKAGVTTVEEVLRVTRET